MTGSDWWVAAALGSVLILSLLPFIGNRRGLFVTLWVWAGELYLAYVLYLLLADEVPVSARGTRVVYGVLGAYATKICVAGARWVAQWGRGGR